MKKLSALFCLPLCLSLLAGCSQGEGTTSRDRSFSEQWRFVRDSVVSAEAMDYDDSGWITVDLPHDFSLMPLPGGDTEDQVGPFSKRSPGMNSTGHVMGGTGWYRKSFMVDQADADKRFTLVFDGSYMETDVWVNGQKMGDNKNGYTPFAFDITSALRAPGEENVVAVKVANIGKNSRWYSGSGLYRDVRLVVTDPLHVDVWGVYVTTPEVSTESATVCLEVTLRNDDSKDVVADVSFNLINKEDGLAVTSEEQVEMKASSDMVVRKQVSVDHPALWSVDHPVLYQAEIVVKRDGKVVDTYTQPFGIRTLAYSADKGFLLNGEPVLLKGGCMHHDNGFLGSAAIRQAEYHRVQVMKDNGYNAIRCAHNPPSQFFLDACDELGVLVIDEFTDMWNIHKSQDDYSRFFDARWEEDLTHMMLRDRNHPSIILWSIGNEIPKKDIADGVRIGTMLKDKMKQLDDTRAITEAVPNFIMYGGWKNSYAYFDVLDVCGYNYMDRKYVSDHQTYPDRIMFGSESYPTNAYESWKPVEEYPYVIGDFVWTALDYIGEVAIGNAKYVKEIKYNAYQDMDGIPVGTDIEKMFDMMNSYSVSAWPNYISWCGDVDIIGEKKPQGRYRDVLWDQSVIEMNVHEPIPQGLVEEVSGWGWPQEFSSWNWEGNEGVPLQVRVFTKAPQVRLELNGQTVGEKTLSEADKYIAEFRVPYQQGNLTAIALKEGQEIGRKELVTTGKAQSIKLTVDRSDIHADRGDLAFIRIDAVDEAGRIVPTSDVTVDISVTGAGELVASGSANPADMGSVNRPRVRLYRGQAQAIVRPFRQEGEIDVHVETEGLTSSDARILVK